MKILFIPCFNCESQIQRVIQQLSDNNADDVFDEIIIIDNQSTDNTVNNALKIIEEVSLFNCTVFQNSKNVGLGGSHKMAFRYAKEKRAEYIAVLHGDDQGDIIDLLALMQKGEHKNYDCCLGSRFSIQSKLKGYSRFRIFGNYMFNILFTLCARKFITDLGAGINIYKVSAITDPQITNFSNDLTFNCYLLLFSVHEKQKVKFFPITWKEEDQISNVKLFSQSINTLKIILKYLFFGLKKFNVNKINFDDIFLVNTSK